MLPLSVRLIFLVLLHMSDSWFIFLYTMYNTKKALIHILITKDVIYKVDWLSTFLLLISNLWRFNNFDILWLTVHVYGVNVKKNKQKIMELFRILSRIITRCKNSIRAHDQTDFIKLLSNLSFSNLNGLNTTYCIHFFLFSYVTWTLRIFKIISTVPFG